jgi:hypothetical protein
MIHVSKSIYASSLETRKPGHVLLPTPDRLLSRQPPILHGHKSPSCPRVFLAASASRSSCHRLSVLGL